jgi:hypothetical protein
MHVYHELKTDSARTTKAVRTNWNARGLLLSTPLS